MQKGKLFVISGPSGVGKGTICEAILAETDLRFSVSMTTRAPRDYEKEGVDYYFVTREVYDKTIEENGFLEHAEVYGNCYGTPRAPIEKSLEKGESVLLDIDIQGADNVKKMMPEAVTIFVLPPSLEELRKRLVNRGSETEESLEKRLGTAAEFMSHADRYDYSVVNDDIETAVNDVKHIIEEELK